MTFFSIFYNDSGHSRSPHTKLKMVMKAHTVDTGFGKPRPKRKRDNTPPEPPKREVYDHERVVIAVSVIRSHPIVQFFRHNDNPSVQTMITRELYDWNNNYRFTPNNRKSSVDGILIHRNTDGSESRYNCDLKYISHDIYPVVIPRGTVLMVHANKPQIEAGLFLVAISEYDHFRVYLCELNQTATTVAPPKASKQSRKFQST